MSPLFAKIVDLVMGKDDAASTGSKQNPLDNPLVQALIGLGVGAGIIGFLAEVGKNLGWFKLLR